MTARTPLDGAPAGSLAPGGVESRDPATGEVWRRYPSATTTDVARAVAVAREAQREWGARPVGARARVLERFRRALYARRDEVAESLVRETGKPLAEALGSEILIGLDHAHFYAGESRRLFDARWFGPSSLSPASGAAMRRARAVAERIEAGTVAINDVTIVAGMADVPHGGVKASGSGRSHGRAGLLECVRTQTLIGDRFGRWAQPWWFGGASAADLRDGLDAVLRLAHGGGMRERLSGVWGTIRLIRKQGKR